jgi:protein-S-isoprenylcysteine O-methyltransferase Ste14
LELAYRDRDPVNENTDRAQVMVPPPLVFLGYLAGALILNWIIPLTTPWTLILRFIGELALITGILLVTLAFSQMMKAHTTPDISRPTTALVTAGPYRLTRNPIYLGFFLIYLGFTLLAGTLWGVLLGPFLFWTVTNAIIRFEEEYLKKKFENEYAHYLTRVRCWI